MNRIRVSTVTALLASALGIGGCEQGGGGDAARTAPEAEVAIPDDVSLPSAEEAAAEATRTISEENADAAFDELTREIEAEAEGDG